MNSFTKSTFCNSSGCLYWVVTCAFSATFFFSAFFFDGLRLMLWAPITADFIFGEY